VIKLLN